HHPHSRIGVAPRVGACADHHGERHHGIAGSGTSGHALQSTPASALRAKASPKINLVLAPNRFCLTKINGTVDSDSVVPYSGRPFVPLEIRRRTMASSGDLGEPHCWARRGFVTSAFLVSLLRVVAVAATVTVMAFAPAHARYSSLVIDAATGQVLHERD